MADIVFRKERVAVFIDGCYWHGCPEHGKAPATNSEYWSSKIRLNRERDARNNAALRATGWLVVRVWEHDATEAAELVRAAVMTARASQTRSSQK